MRRPLASPSVVASPKPNQGAQAEPGRYAHLGPAHAGGLGSGPNATAWRAAPWTGQEAQGVLNETRPLLLKILYNTSCIVCKRACRRRRCPQSDRGPGGVAASYWMAERVDDPPLRNRRSSLGAFPPPTATVPARSWSSTGPKGLSTATCDFRARHFGGCSRQARTYQCGHRWSGPLVVVRIRGCLGKPTRRADSWRISRKCQWPRTGGRR